MSKGYTCLREKGREKMAGDIDGVSLVRIVECLITSKSVARLEPVDTFYSDGNMLIIPDNLNEDGSKDGNKNGSGAVTQYSPKHSPYAIAEASHISRLPYVGAVNSNSDIYGGVIFNPMPRLIYAHQMDALKQMVCDEYDNISKLSDSSNPKKVGNIIDLDV